MTVEIEQKIKDFIGKIDILKLSHHGYSESSYEFLKVVQPKYVIILNDIIPHYSYSIINYLKDNYNTKIYLTGNISKSSQSIENSAIKLIFKKDGTEYEFINTGNEVELDKLYGQLMIWKISEDNLENDKESKEKAHEHVVYASNRLASYLEEIKLSFGIENNQDKARRGM